MENFSNTQLGLIVLVTQIVFVWLRTLNIKQIENNNLLGAIITGNGIGLMWMVGIAIGANAMMEGNWFPILMHLVGGSIGTYLGMRRTLKPKTKSGLTDKNGKCRHVWGKWEANNDKNPFSGHLSIIQTQNRVCQICNKTEQTTV